MSSSTSSYCSLINVSTAKTVENQYNIERISSETASSSTLSNSNNDEDEIVSNFNLTDDDAISEEFETNLGEINNGKLFLNTQNLKRLMWRGGKFPNGRSRIQSNLVSLLKHRQVD